MAEDAIARAKAIAARLSGTAAPAMIPQAPSGMSAQLAADRATAEAASAALEAALGGGGGAPASSTKRKRWGADDSDAGSKQPKLNLPGLGGAPAGGGGGGGGVDDALRAALMASNVRTSSKIPIPVEKNPGYNYVGLLIGPGGRKQRELVEKAGGRVKISIRGGKDGGG
eukprot:CAMPEP_0113557044 /NCGR_PEP_ID=MMETSP0015_2-20120614/17578_1 /TAXON_ID=2838 /ORGANISM="Odontella" /LENGTH=169 /DNA_ID=CAMNT_0000458437 /DNA_START=138 /DNA_END=644 /DNA_ORIENTATION=- /assembly_acc=CAM_ASM_000160